MSDLAQLKPYPNYKDSGVEWLGEVPEHWKATPMKYIAVFINGAPFKPTDWGEESIPIIRIENLNGGDQFNHTTLQVGPKYHVKRDDLLFAWSGNRGTSFGPFLWEKEGLYYLNQHIFRLEGYKLSKKFFYWALKGVTNYVERQAHGIIGLVHITKADLGIISVPTIPDHEQSLIAAFLDRETAKIDAMISKKKRLIELLQEKRAAIISHAVTRGLDQSVIMKGSGVEWLGEIPAHWKVEELNRHWQIIDCKHRTATYVDEGIPIVSTTEVKPGRLDLSQTRKTTYEEYMNLTEGNRLPRRGNIIYTRNASLGSAAYVDTDEPFCMGQDVCLINSYDQNQLFLNYQLNSPVVVQQLEALMVGATFRRINICQIKKFVIIRPPKEEQQQIVKYLDEVSERTNTLVAKINESMEKLKEYRTTIVSTAVTGKIDVRN